MRILHTSDWHLGKQLNNFSLIEDQYYVLNALLRELKGLKLDCIIISGDIYDRSIPSPEAVSLFDEILTRLWSDFKKPVLIISGNHDSPERLDFGSTLFGKMGIRLYARANCALNPFITPDEHGDVVFCPIPYLEPAVAREILRRDDLHSHQAVMEAVCQEYAKQLPRGTRSIIVAHAFVSGAETSESERPLSVGGAEAVSAELFSSFTYTALGHLHKPQSLLAGNVRYSGSLLKYSQSEITHKKSTSIIELDATGKFTFEELPIVPKRDMRRVTGRFSELIEGKGDLGNRQDLIVVSLEDQGPILDAAGRLREIFPNLLGIERPHLESNMRLEEHSREEIRSKSDIDLFKAFSEQVSEVPLGEEHMRFFMQTIEKLNISRREA